MTIEDIFWCVMMFIMLYMFLFMWFTIENNVYFTSFQPLY